VFGMLRDFDLFFTIDQRRSGSVLFKVVSYFASHCLYHRVLDLNKFLTDKINAESKPSKSPFP
jgi:hypothetical protein